MEKDLDMIDRKILTELQRDATLPIATLADKVGLSQTPCWKRVQKLEAAGIITNRVALVDPRKVGLGLTVLCEIEAMNHTPAWRDKFMAAVAMNAIGMLIREQENPVEPYDKALSDALLAGTQSLATPGLLARLRKNALAKLANDVPKYAALNAARQKWTA